MNKEKKKNTAIIIAFVAIIALIFLVLVMNQDDVCELETYKTEAGEEIPASKHYLAKGKEFFDAGQYDNAEEFFNKTIELCLKEMECYKKKENEADIKMAKVEIMGSYMYLGIIYANKERYDDGIAHYKKALNLAKEVGYMETRGEIYYAMGGIYAFTGENALAIEKYEEAIAIKMKNYTQNKENIAHIYESMGNCSYAIQRYGSAAQYYNKSLAIKKEVNDWEGASHIADLYSMTGAGYMSVREYFKALDVYKEVLEIKKSAGAGSEDDIKNARLNVANAKYFIGAESAGVGDDKTAVKYYMESLVIMGDYQNDGDVNKDIADINFCLGVILGYGSNETAVYYDEKSDEYAKVNIPNISLSISHYKSALDIYLKLENDGAENMSDKIRLADTYFNMAGMYFEEEQHSNANDAYGNALERYDALDLPVYRSRISDLYFYIGECLYYMNDRSNAIAHFDKSLELKNELNSTGQDIGDVPIMTVSSWKSYALSS